MDGGSKMKSGGGAMKGTPRHSGRKGYSIEQETKANSRAAVAPLNASILISAAQQINAQCEQMEKMQHRGFAKK